MKNETLYYNGVFHSMRSEDDTFSAMSVGEGRITGTYTVRPSGDYASEVDLGGKHVYPCLIDGHTHLLLTVAMKAVGFSICEITPHGVEPHTLTGVEARLRRYAEAQKQNAVIACSNYILSAMDDEQRLPTREELDDWGGGRPVVVYTIDGHSTALSSAMLRLVGIDPEGHSGVLTGEENDRMQGRLTDALSAVITPAALARGIAAFENACAAYGISVVGALEGNGDSEKDPTTGLIVRLARHMDVGVRLYLQYTDLARVKPYLKWMRRPRVGGCGDWEMDGAAGSHSAAFSLPYRDSGETAECYYEQDFVDALTAEADALGWQISSHAIGDRAIERLLTAYEKLPGGRLHRIEHCEFLTDELFERLRQGDYALMMQPGYSWIDKRYLHSYESFLPEEILSSLRFRSLLDAGLCVCGSSDSPVQELDPWLQMLGMVQFYREEESVTPFDALRCYTVNPARALGEEAERGTLEAGKAADFFTAERDFFTLSPAEIAAFRPEETYYGGVKYRPRRGSLPELAAMLLRKPRMI